MVLAFIIVFEYKTNKGAIEMTLRTYIVHLTNKGLLSTGTVSAKNEKEAMNNARSKWKYTDFKVLSVSLKV